MSAISEKASAACNAHSSELLQSLKGMVRIVDAFSRSNMLGKTQADRMRAAQELIKKIEAEQ